MTRVLIADKMDSRAAAVFRERGIEVGLVEWAVARLRHRALDATALSGRRTRAAPRV